MDLLEVNTRYTWDNLLIVYRMYLRSGCMDRILVEAVVYVAILLDHLSMYYLALHVQPYITLAVDVQNVFNNVQSILSGGDNRYLSSIFESLPKSKPEFTNNGIYLIHSEGPSLQCLCIYTIRSVIFRANSGCSVLPYIDQLPVPMIIKDLIRLKEFSPEHDQDSVHKILDRVNFN